MKILFSAVQYLGFSTVGVLGQCTVNSLSELSTAVGIDFGNGTIESPVTIGIGTKSTINIKCSDGSTCIKGTQVSNNKDNCVINLTCTSTTALDINSSNDVKCRNDCLIVSEDFDVKKLIPSLGSTELTLREYVNTSIRSGGVLEARLHCPIGKLCTGMQTDRCILNLSCWDGEVSFSEIPTCTSFDECSLSPCSENGTCKSVDIPTHTHTDTQQKNHKGFECNCNAQYHGDGFICLPDDVREASQFFARNFGPNLLLIFSVVGGIVLVVGVILLRNIRQKKLMLVHENKLKKEHEAALTKREAAIERHKALQGDKKNILIQEKKDKKNIEIQDKEYKRNIKIQGEKDKN
eukprot:GHVR01110082.1.p1 GENE.GHVR01110082.1~~GHVR01110082.1.p1  ORF type:complete len:350 (-),score=100.32 GHVR01110082.1:330-1379(-)